MSEKRILMCIDDDPAWVDIVREEAVRAGRTDLDFVSADNLVAARDLIRTNAGRAAAVVTNLSLIGQNGTEGLEIAILAVAEGVTAVAINTARPFDLVERPEGVVVLNKQKDDSPDGTLYNFLATAA